MAVEKSTVIRVRITPELKEEFLALCDTKSINASELLRKMIAQWVEQNKE